MGAAIFSNLMAVKNNCIIFGHSHYETSTIFDHPVCEITFDENVICHFSQGSTGNLEYL
jgi:hypothetical protein